MSVGDSGKTQKTDSKDRVDRDTQVTGLGAAMAPRHGDKPEPSVDDVVGDVTRLRHE